MTFTFQQAQRLLAKPLTHDLLELEVDGHVFTNNLLKDVIAYVEFVHPGREFTFGRDPDTGKRLCRRTK